MTYILSIDQGTTSSRAIAFNRKGEILGISQKEFTQHFPQSGWVEHDPEEIWTSQLEVTREVIKKMGVPQAIGITNQRETTVVWERSTGKPVYNAIVWQDRRTADFCDQLKVLGHHTLFESRTGLILDAYFSGTKLRWILDHIPDGQARAERGDLAFGTIDSWLIWKLTKGRLHITDVSNASRTLLLNLETCEWDEDLLTILNIPSSVLPELKPSSQIVGTTDSEVLGYNIPIAGIAGDQQAASFGQACFTPGQAKNTYGTGCFILMNCGPTPRRSSNRLLSTIGWQVNRETSYCIEGSVFIAGASVQWLRDSLQIIESAEEIETLAKSVDDHGDVWFVPAFAGLGAPDWDVRARGMMIGMTRGTTRGHIARATLASIAHQSADVIQAINSDSQTTLKELRVDGGASNNNLLMQMQADLLGVPLLRPNMTETTAFGAACLAGLATGFWADISELEDCWTLDRRFDPVISDFKRQESRSRWREAVARAREWA